MQFQVDRCETGHPGQFKQGALGEVRDRAGRELLGRVRKLCSLPTVQQRPEAIGRRRLLGRRIDHLSQGAGRERVVLEDGLGKRDATARFQDTEKLSQGGALVGNIGEHGPRRDHIDGRIRDGAEFVRATFNESALLPHTALGRKPFDMTEQGGGDVSENDAEGWPDALDGTEGYETRTGADIG